MTSPRGRSFLATVVGWLIVLLIAWFVFGFVIGALRALVRFVALLVVVGVLAAMWLKLRRDD